MSQNINEMNLKQKELRNNSSLRQKQKKIFIHQQKSDFIFCSLCPVNRLNQTVQNSNPQKTKYIKYKKQIGNKQHNKITQKKSLKKNKSELLLYSCPINECGLKQKKKIESNFKLAYSLNANRNQKSFNAESISKSSCVYKPFTQKQSIRLINNKDSTNLSRQLISSSTNLKQYQQIYNLQSYHNLQSYQQIQTKKQMLISIQTIDSMPRIFQNNNIEMIQSKSRKKQERFQSNQNKQQQNYYLLHQNQNIESKTDLNSNTESKTGLSSHIESGTGLKIMTEFKQPPVLQKDKDSYLNEIINFNMESSIQSIKETISLNQALQACVQNSQQLKVQQKNQHQIKLKLINKTGKLDNFKLRKTVSLREKQQSEDQCSQVLVGNRKIGRYQIMSNIQQNMEQSLMTCMQKSANKETFFQTKF